MFSDETSLLQVQSVLAPRPKFCHGSCYTDTATAWGGDETAKCYDVTGYWRAGDKACNGCPECEGCREKAAYESRSGTRAYCKSAWEADEKEQAKTQARIRARREAEAGDVQRPPKVCSASCYTGSDVGTSWGQQANRPGSDLTGKCYDTTSWARANKACNGCPECKGCKEKAADEPRSGTIGLCQAAYEADQVTDALELEGLQCVKCRAIASGCAGKTVGGLACDDCSPCKPAAGDA